MNAANFNWTELAKRGYDTISAHSGFWGGACPYTHQRNTYCVTCRGPEPFLIPAGHFAINMARRPDGP